MFVAYLPTRQTVTYVLNQKHYRCLEPGPSEYERKRRGANSELLQFIIRDRCENIPRWPWAALAECPGVFDILN